MLFFYFITYSFASIKFPVKEYGKSKFESIFSNEAPDVTLVECSASIGFKPENGVGEFVSTVEDEADENLKPPFSFPKATFLRS